METWTRAIGEEKNVLLGKVGRKTRNSLARSLVARLVIARLVMARLVIARLVVARLVIARYTNEPES